MLRPNTQVRLAIVFTVGLQQRLDESINATNNNILGCFGEETSEGEIIRGIANNFAGLSLEPAQVDPRGNDTRDNHKQRGRE